MAPLTSPQNEQAVARKRRAHNKSRSGCRNCKLRRVKCDELRPECKKCIQFGVSCNFKLSMGDLQPRGAMSAINDLKKPVLSVNEMMVDMLNLSLDRQKSESLVCDKNFRLTGQHLSRLSRFQEITALTLGSPRTAALYRDVTLFLATRSLYLMHLVLCMSAIHERYCAPPPNHSQTPSETYHWIQATALFNEKLSKEITESDRDPLWAAAAVLGTIAFSTIEADCAENAWPLKSDGVRSSLDWIRMSGGKQAIWVIADPLRPTSVFYSLKDMYQKDYLPLPAGVTPETGLLQRSFLDLCEIRDIDTTSSNPYYSAVTHLVPLLDFECTETTFIKFLGFFGHMTTEFRELLEAKDPRAMLLLAYWYAKVWDVRWWIAKRAILECQAICMYIERYYPQWRALQQLLRYPKMKSGLIRKAGSCSSQLTFLPVTTGKL